VAAINNPNQLVLRQFSTTCFRHPGFRHPLSGPGEVGTGLLRSYIGWDQAAAMRAASVPVRCVNADKWPTNTAANRHYCDFDVTIIPGVGHFLMQEAPDQLNTALVDTVLSIVIMRSAFS